MFRKVISDWKIENSQCFKNANNKILPVIQRRSKRRKILDIEGLEQREWLAEFTNRRINTY